MSKIIQSCKNTLNVKSKEIINERVLKDIININTLKE